MYEVKVNGESVIKSDDQNIVLVVFEVKCLEQVQNVEGLMLADNKQYYSKVEFLDYSNKEFFSTTIEAGELNDE